MLHKLFRPRKPLEDQEARGVDPDQRQPGEDRDGQCGAGRRQGDRAEDRGESPAFSHPVPAEGEGQQVISQRHLGADTANVILEVRTYGTYQ